MKAVKKESQHPGIDQFIEKIGYESIDKLGKIQLIKLAFLAGRVWEAKNITKKFTVKEQAE